MHVRNFVSRIPMRMALNLCFVLAILITLIAGYSFSQSRASSTSAGPVSANQAFTQASADFHVPASLLMAICYMGGRLSNNGGSPSIDNGFGCMHLVKNAQADTLDQAAQDLEVSVHTLQQDLPTNIRGGAAILRDTALKLSSNQTLPANLADWYNTVAAYSHVSVPSTARMYADAVYNILNQGFTIQTDQHETVTLAPQAVKPNTAGALVPHMSGIPSGCVDDGNVDYPGAIDCIVSQTLAPGAPEKSYDCNVTTTTTCTYSGSDRPNGCNVYDSAFSQQEVFQPCKVNQVVIHDTEGSAASALGVFQNINSHESVHYLIDTDGTVYQLLREQDIAYHAGNTWYNEHSIGIEHVGFDAQGYNWYNATEYLASAKLVAYLLKKYNLPLDRFHIVAHGTIPSPGLAAGANHEDPGPYWLWDYYFGLINQQGVAYPAGNPPPNTITLHPQSNKSGAESPSVYNFYKLYNGPSTKSGIIPQQGNNDPIDVSYNVEPGVSYYFMAKAPDSGGTNNTMYEIWFGEEDQVHTSQSSYFADGKTAWLAVPPGDGVEGTGLTLNSHSLITLESSNGLPNIYGRPTTSGSYNDIIGNAPVGSVFVTGYSVVEDHGNTIWYEIDYNHRQAWVPASELPALNPL